jgi:hypothetical protein
MWKMCKEIHEVMMGRTFSSDMCTLETHANISWKIGQLKEPKADEKVTFK